MDADVLVIGAGIAGLTTAACLQRVGLEVDVVETASALPETGAGMMLHPNALTHLRHLELAVAQAGRFIERQLIMDIDGSKTVVDWPEVWAHQGRPLAIHRGLLARILLRRLLPHTVRWSMTPSSIAQGTDQVSVTFPNRETRSYKLVIGADGINSWVRHAIDPAAVPRYLGHTYWRTTVPAGDPFDFSEWRVWRAGQLAFGVMPIGAVRLHVFLQAGLEMPQWPTRSAARAQMMLLVRTMGSSSIYGLVSALGVDAEFDVHPAFTVLASQWVRGRVAIVGDAAHAVSPATTQGAALAIEDAAVLAAEVARRGANPDALTAFEARRRPRVLAFARLARCHVALIDPARQAGRTTLPSAARQDTRNGAGWFRRLYAPLLDPA